MKARERIKEKFERTNIEKSKNTFNRIQCGFSEIMGTAKTVEEDK
jgi:hypothetical protein